MASVMLMITAVFLTVLGSNPYRIKYTQQAKRVQNARLEIDFADFSLSSVIDSC